MIKNAKLQQALRNQTSLCCIRRPDEIEVSPKNRHFILYSSQFLLGKSEGGIGKFDVLHSGVPDAGEVVIPAQISTMGERSFLFTGKLKSIIFEKILNTELLNTACFRAHQLRIC